MLDGFSGWTFKHHLGHGIGLCNHEAPRLNPRWNDTLEVGDVFTEDVAFQVMQSVRLDLGYGAQGHP